jgi:hypothetical protein
MSQYSYYELVKSALLALKLMVRIFQHYYTSWQKKKVRSECIEGARVAHSKILCAFLLNWYWESILKVTGRIYF